MPADASGIAAYQATQKKSLSPREVEAMAFTKAALMMEDAQKAPDDYDKYAQALRFNQLLWTIIQADVTDPANQLPPELKANVVSLSIFVDKHTGSALLEGKPEMLNVLININRNLAEGLRVMPGRGESEQAQPARPNFDMPDSA
ncbi:MAG: flagellar biosynthesis regulator FlaF [Rhodospirillales bacterium]